MNNQILQLCHIILSFLVLGNGNLGRLAAVGIERKGQRTGFLTATVCTGRNLHTVIRRFHLETGRGTAYLIFAAGGHGHFFTATGCLKGYNNVSRHIVYAGGVAKDGKTPKDTRTGCQKKALEKYVKDFHRRFPDVRIVGHNELAAKACPSFDVQKWLKEIGINQ